MWWGTIVGFAFGIWLSYSYILPGDILNLKLSALTVGDIFRMIGALVIIGICAGIGHLVDIGTGNAD